MKAGWQPKTLGEVYDVRDGTHDSPKYHTTGYPLITSKNLKRDGLSFDDVSLINEQDYKKINERSAVHKGDVLLAMIGTIGNPTLVEVEPNFAIKNVALFKVPNGQSGAFLKHYLDSGWVSSKMMKEAKGTTQRFVGLGYLRDFPINIPSLPEQQRIVGILDEALYGIATAKANAEQNLQNARALFESHLQSAFTQRGEGWVERELQDVVDANCTLSYGIVQPGDEFPDGLPVIRPTDLTSKVISLNGLKRINPKLADSYKRTTLRGGELLLCVRGSTGVVSLASDELEGANVTRGIVPIRFNSDLIIRDFAYYLMISEHVQQQIREKTYGAALMQINIGDLRKISAPYPPVSHQVTIAEKLGSLFAETQHLESIYQQKLSALDALKKSLLDQAFTGVL